MFFPEQSLGPMVIHQVFTKIIKHSRISTLTDVFSLATVIQGASYEYRAIKSACLDYCVPALWDNPTCFFFVFFFFLFTHFHTVPLQSDKHSLVFVIPDWI